MDLHDFLAIIGLQWVYDTVEELLGPVIAWVATIALTLVYLGLVVAAYVVFG